MSPNPNMGIDASRMVSRVSPSIGCDTRENATDGVARRVVSGVARSMSWTRRCSWRMRRKRGSIYHVIHELNRDTMIH